MIRVVKISTDDSYKVLIDYGSYPDYCYECKFAHALATKLYTCDGDEESLVYCDKHEVFCRAQRPACDWAAISVE